jgi:hypothetical protein
MLDQVVAMTVRDAQHRAAVERRLDALDDALRHAGAQLDMLRSATAAIDGALHVMHRQLRLARAANAGDTEVTQ